MRYGTLDRRLTLRPRALMVRVEPSAAAQFVAIMNTPDVRERFVAAGTEPGTSTPEQLAERIASEFGRYEKLLAQLGLRGS